jgi:hypothetical protein
MVSFHYDNEHVTLAQSIFPCHLATFPLTYLGLPLLVHQLCKTALQSLLDKMAGSWLGKGKLLHRSGQLTLFKTTLVVIPIYTLISIKLPPWLRKAIEKIMKAFMWTGSDTVQGKVSGCLEQSAAASTAGRLGNAWSTKHGDNIEAFWLCL